VELAVVVDGGNGGGGHGGGPGGGVGGEGGGKGGNEVSEGITSVLSALGFLNPGLHLMQTLFIFLNLEQNSQLLRILLITCNFSFTSLWGIQSLQHTLKYWTQLQQAPSKFGYD
jgi:hypothetical protein